MDINRVYFLFFPVYYYCYLKFNSSIEDYNIFIPSSNEDLEEIDILQNFFPSSDFILIEIFIVKQMKTILKV